MKHLKLLTLIAIIGSFVACGEDDETTPGSRGVTVDNSLTGKWKAYEFLGDDGLTYGLNEFVPYYDTSFIPGCVVKDYEEKIAEQTYTFSLDSIVDFKLISTDRYRSYTVNNASTCDITYDAWTEEPSNFAGQFIYSELNNTQLLVWEKGDQGNKDTIDYIISNGILQFDDDQTVKFRK